MNHKKKALLILALVSSSALADHETVPQYTLSLGGQTFTADNPDDACQQYASAQTQIYEQATPHPDCGIPREVTNSGFFAFGSNSAGPTGRCRIFTVNNFVSGTNQTSGESTCGVSGEDITTNLQVTGQLVTLDHEPEEEDECPTAGTPASYTVTTQGGPPLRACLSMCTVVANGATGQELADGSGTAWDVDGSYDGSMCNTDQTGSNIPDDLTDEERCTAGFSTNSAGETICAPSSGDSGDEGDTSGNTDNTDSSQNPDTNTDNTDGSSDGSSDGDSSGESGGSSDGQSGGQTGGTGSDPNANQDACPSNIFVLVNGVQQCREATDTSNAEGNGLLKRIVDLLTVDLAAPQEPEFENDEEELVELQEQLSTKVTELKDQVTSLVSVDLRTSEYSCNRTLSVAGFSMNFCPSADSIDILNILGLAFLGIAHIHAFFIVLGGSRG